MNYAKFCKPSLSAALDSVGLARDFHRGEEQYLYYRDDNGQEQKVLDLLGGYGAVILGHNHPKLISCLQQQLKSHSAFHNQFSLRSASGDLAARLNPLLQQETGWQETFLCAFASTGAESVEVGLKHAELIRSRQLDHLQEKLQQQLEQCELDLQWEISEDILQAHPELSTETVQKNIQTIDLWNQQKFNQAPAFIALKHAFHGKLNASIQLTHGSMYRHPFRRLGLNTYFLAPKELTENTLSQLKKDAQAYALTLKKRRGKLCVETVDLPFIAAIIVEPVQGEGGVYCLSTEDVKHLHYARDYLRCPLISDEIQSGCGRCGSFLAGSQVGLQPDYVVLSKGLGGGVSKIGVVAIRESCYAHGFDLIQSSTFGEDTWSANVANTFIEELTDNDGAILATIRERGHALEQALKGLHQQYPDIIRDIRGKGLLYGIELQDMNHSPSVLINTMNYQEATGYLLTGCLLSRWNIRVAPPASSGRVIRIEPSIQLSDENIHTLVTALEILCLALRYQDMGYLIAHLLDDEQALQREPQDYRLWYESLNIIPAKGEADTKVAFINHLISAEWIKEADPSLAYLSDEQTVQLLNRLAFDRRVAPFAPIRIRSQQGQTVDFSIYPINATSQQIAEMIDNNQLDILRAAVDERLAAARDDGCQIAGLGMFTSIISNNAKAANTSGIYLTTGNALTVAMAAQAIEAMIKKTNRSIQQAAVIGAAGNIGSVYSTLVAEYCQKLILIGSGRQGSHQRLVTTAELVYATIVDEVSQGHSYPGLHTVLMPYIEKNQWLDKDFLAQKNRGQYIYQWFSDNVAKELWPIQISETQADISHADLLVCAANAADDFLKSEYLKPNVLICDIAIPHNIAEKLLATRPDIDCIRGGIVNTPYGESLDIRTRAYLKKGQLYACMAETVALGFEQYQGHYSYGNISKAQVKTIAHYANEHGLVLSDYKTAESM